MHSWSFVDNVFRPCMECSTPDNAKFVAPRGLWGLEVRTKGTGEVAGYLHANCKDAWVSKHGEAEFSFRSF
jgi:hypothetical protein